MVESPISIQRVTRSIPVKLRFYVLYIFIISYPPQELDSVNKIAGKILAARAVIKNTKKSWKNSGTRSAPWEKIEIATTL